ncbi:MAG: heterodisulfide reductase-related iron-sulfur binding cluster, partial [Candidatus Aminicenantales bacterium]
AAHEWENRFKLMVVKRLGPSLVPAEVVVPLEKLQDVLEEIEHKVNQPVVKEGLVIKTGRDGKPEAVILGFIPSDQRKFSYNFVFILTLGIMRIAEKHGGRPYSTGMYFTAWRKNVLGEERARRLKAFKKDVDPRRILNPDKVVVHRPVNWVVRAASGVSFEEMDHNRQEGHCCGSALTLIKEPPVAHEIGRSRLDEAVRIQADTVLALCPCCEFQFRVTKEKKNLPVNIQDLATFACRALGKNFQDPSPEVSRQWAVFESMIALMTPGGFADLMDTMWPELLDAMALGMGKMMRFMGRLGFLGGALLGMMKPLFPVLFPRLLPGMMPKVMPTLLDRVKTRIPMPEYMAEQMPDLMPKVMDNLMPHMLPDMVPLAVPKMIRFLRGRAI